MRTHPILLLIVGLTLAACADTGGPPGTGTLVVSTSTGGTEPDQDGYLLTVDGVNSLVLVPTGTAEVDLPPGRHMLRLLGVAEHCSVAPATSVQVDVPSQGTIPVAFEISCRVTGTLVVSTSTGGNDPDLDGYLLTVDGLDSLVLVPTGTAEVDLPPGQHTLELLGLAEHCSVAPATPLEVDVPPRGTIPVAFEINCQFTGARITATTTGLDFNPFDGYHVDVDGTDRGILPTSGTVLTRLDPGSQTIALTGLAPNCTIDGPDSHTVTIVDTEITPVEFVVVCTATSGVIGVVVEASGTDVDGSYEAMVDGARSFFVGPRGPAYLTRVSAGDHVVSLVAPGNCSVEGDPQSVPVTVGGLIRDTVEVTFSVSCVPRDPGRLRITAPTTGPIPTAPYSVWICNWSCFEVSCHGAFKISHAGDQFLLRRH
jgi:hypothetical protein